MLKASRYTLSSLLVAFAAGCGGGPTTVQEDEGAAQQAAQAQPEATATPGVSGSAKTEFNKGVVALSAQAPDYKAAVTAFEAATKASDDFQPAWLNLAYTYERLGRYSDAVAAYRKLISLNVIDPQVALALGRSLLLAGEPDLAIAEFETVLRKDEQSLKARNNLAAAYISKGDLPTALRYVKEVLAIQPKNVPAIVNLGLLYLRDKKLDLAQLMFEKALGYDKGEARAYNNLGLTFFAKQLFPQAVIQWRKAVELDPTMDEARLNLASVYLDYLHYEAALEQFKAVRERFPNHYQAIVGEANALYGTGEHKEAVALYNQALEIDGRNGEALLRAGKIYEEQLSQPEEALKYYERYISVANPPADSPVRATVQFMKQQAKEAAAAPAQPAAPAQGEEGEAQPPEATPEPAAEAPQG